MGAGDVQRSALCNRWGAHLLGGSASHDDLQALKHAPLGGHRVVLVRAAQEDGPRPIPAPDSGLDPHNIEAALMEM